MGNLIHRKHRCRRRHRSYRTLACCIWKRATIEGEGPYALRWRDRQGLVVALLPDEESAIDARRDLEAFLPLLRFRIELLVSPEEAEGI